jgi:tRNA (uracil-5-)-methyltransferase
MSLSRPFPYCRAAVACAEEAGVSNVCLAPLSAEEATQAFNGDREFFRLKERGIDVGTFDCKTILVDPPRAGLDDASLSLTQKFDEVMYISCNPANLVRDLERMPTHKIVSAAVFDQFPWTQHAEVAVKLQRR